jgi:hypothetical protein
LTKTAIVPAKNNSSAILKYFCADKYITKIAEAIDWIIKYFMADSFVLFMCFFIGFLIRVQKVRVFTSNATHKTTQEFLTRHMIGVMIKDAVMIGKAEISMSLKNFKLQVWRVFGKTCLNSNAYFEDMRFLT